MLKNCTKIISVVLALLLVSASLACLAETERDTVIDGYEKLDSKLHTVYVTIMEYPIIDGERGSGKPVGEESYTEPHDFEDGVCVDCGYALPVDVGDDDDDDDDDYYGDDDDDDDDDDDSSSSGTTSTETEAPAAEASIITIAGATLAKGMPAAEALKTALTALPANTEVTITGVDAEVAEGLLNAIQNGATPQELLALLKDFPVQNIDGVDCYVVTLSYTDAAGAPVTENYAFSVVDGTLVKVF